MYAVATESRSAALRTLLRSLGQIVLQPNAITGVCLLGAWLVCDPRLACAALIGAVSANVSAMLAGYAEDETRAGLHGFNGALAGLAAFTHIADSATAVAVTMLAATGTAWVLRPLASRLRAAGLGYFSSPCLVVTWAWLALVPAMSLPGARASAVQTVWLSTDAVRHVDFAQTAAGLFAGWCAGWLSGLGQTAFASGAVSGALVLAGIAASSRRHACWALIGAALASAALGVAGVAGAGAFDAGLLGFNGALTALALADGGALSTLAGIGATVAVQAVAMRLGWPAMTAPFVLGTWAIQWCRRVVVADKTVGLSADERKPRAGSAGAAIRHVERGGG